MVTGAAGFIGSHFARAMLDQARPVLSVDKMSYAANLGRLDGYLDRSDHTFVACSVEDTDRIYELLTAHRPVAIVHFAAESHVDRSIDGPRDFLSNNTCGTFELLTAALGYWQDSLDPTEQDRFRFLHISTDEVYGAAGTDAFTENSPFRPNSPYAASKAGAEGFARSFQVTYGLPVVIARPSNTYGPGQFPEKLIPLMIAKALDGAPLPIYGDGLQQREWLFIDDHVAALEAILASGVPGQAYNLAGYEERQNIQVVEGLCAHLDRLRPRSDGRSYLDQKSHVEDRPGHDRRYALNGALAQHDLSWQARVSFDDGLAQTVAWYLDHEDWWRAILESRYDGHRIGTGKSRNGG